MAMFLELVGALMFALGCAALFFMFKGVPASIFVESISFGLIGGGAIVMGLGAIVRRLDVFAATLKKPEAVE